MSIYYQDAQVTLHHGDAQPVLEDMPDAAVDCIVTSPPYYGLRDYGEEGQIGAEDTPAEYVARIVSLFREARRVLADDGTLWLNLGDSYGATKNLMGSPWRVAFALQDDGWILRNDIIWHKPNAMPESVTDRLSNRHEHVFMFSKSQRYWFDLDAIREPALTMQPDNPGYRANGKSDRRRKAHAAPPGQSPQTNMVPSGSRHSSSNEKGRNPGDVWAIPTQPFSGAHFAAFPLVLAERCVQAGCKPGGTVLDPFSGSGTTGLAAARHGRRYVGIDLSRDYLELSLKTRLAQSTLDFTALEATT